MADTEEKLVPITVTSDESKSASDLEAEIAATAAALGDPSSSAKIPVPAEPAKTPPAPEPAPAEKPATPVAVKPVAKESTPKVQIKKRPTLSTAQQNTDKADGEPVKVTVAKKAPSEGGSRVIAPLSKGKTANATEDPAKPAPAKPAAPSISDIAKKSDESADEAKAETKDDSFEAARKLDALSGELKQREEDKKELDSQQELKVYDTKQYHLPISANHHHRKSALPMWARALVIIVALLGALAYAYSMDLLSFSDDTSEPVANPVVDVINDAESEDEQTGADGEMDLVVGAPPIEITADDFTIELPDGWSTADTDAFDSVFTYTNDNQSFIVDFRWDQIFEFSSDLKWQYTYQDDGSTFVASSPRELCSAAESDTCEAGDGELKIIIDPVDTTLQVASGVALTFNAIIDDAEDPSDPFVDEVREIVNSFVFTRDAAN